MANFDTFIENGVTVLSELVSSANAVADKVINAENQNKAIYDVRETSDDPEIVKFREWLDNANLAIEKRIKTVDEYIVSKGYVSNETVDVPTETENYKTLAAQVKAMLNTINSLPNGAEATAKLPELKAIPGARKASSTSGGGTGTRRPRLSQIVVDLGDGNKFDVYETKKDDKTGEDVNVANLTVLSKVLSNKFKTKVEVKDLQSALFAEAKTDDLSTLEGKPVTFAVSIPGEGDTSHNVMVTATPNVK